MSREKVERIEFALDAGASALLGVASAVAALRLVPSLFAWTGLAAFAGSLVVLRRIAPEDRVFRLPDFLVEPTRPVEADELLLTEMVELLLTEADRFLPADDAGDDELVLDDILAKLGGDSRVVRLFDASAMPTPGQLKARIDRHLNDGHPPSSDASQALHEALAELRRSLR